MKRVTFLILIFIAISPIVMYGDYVNITDSQYFHQNKFNLEVSALQIFESINEASTDLIPSETKKLLINAYIEVLNQKYGSYDILLHLSIRNSTTVTLNSANSTVLNDLQSLESYFVHRDYYTINQYDDGMNHYLVNSNHTYVNQSHFLNTLVNSEAKVNDKKTVIVDSSSQEYLYNQKVFDYLRPYQIINSTSRSSNYRQYSYFINQFDNSSTKSTDSNASIILKSNVTVSSSNTFTTNIVINDYNFYYKESFNDLILTVIIGFLLVITSHVLNIDADELIIKPINRMLNLVEAVVKNPLRQFQSTHHHDESKTDTG